MKKLHILKEQKPHPKSLHDSDFDWSKVKMVTYSTSYCGEKFSQYAEEHVHLQDLENSLQRNQRTQGKEKLRDDICEDCMESPEIQLLLLKWTDI